MYRIPLGKILESLSRSYQKYADDTVSYFRIGNIHNNCEEIDEKLNRIIEWFAWHELKLNGGKTEIMLLKLKRNFYDSVINIDWQNLEPVKDLKLLGVAIDDCFIFEERNIVSMQCIVWLFEEAV